MKKIISIIMLSLFMFPYVFAEQISKEDFIEFQEYKKQKKQEQEYREFKAFQEYKKQQEEKAYQEYKRQQENKDFLEYKALQKQKENVSESDEKNQNYDNNGNNLSEKKYNSETGLILKVGYLFSPELTLKNSRANESYSKDSIISLGAEIFSTYSNEASNNSIEFCPGFTWVQQHQIISELNGFEIGFTNIYIGVKPKFLLTKEKKDYMYIVANFGVGIINVKKDNETMPGNLSVRNGLYWEIGAGIEIDSFILEIAYSRNYGSVKYIETFYDRYEYYTYTIDADLYYSSVKLKIGYKINL